MPCDTVFSASKKFKSCGHSDSYTRLKQSLAVVILLGIMAQGCGDVNNSSVL